MHKMQTHVRTAKAREAGIPEKQALRQRRHDAGILLSLETRRLLYMAVYHYYRFDP